MNRGKYVEYNIHRVQRSRTFTMDDSWGGLIHYKVNQAKFNFNNSNIVFRYYL